jgi:hypothetical protein
MGWPVLTSSSQERVRRGAATRDRHGFPGRAYVPFEGYRRGHVRDRVVVRWSDRRMAVAALTSAYS